AHAGEGGYIGIEGGANWKADQNLYGPIVDSNVRFGDPLNNGWICGLVLGTTTSFGLRPELELSYRRNDVDNVRVGNLTRVQAEGFE
ncbi:hypothetical protein NQU49_26505, partial [Escherichia coli]|uniref:hypothetical protein n=1 Tax=Escherichia coli TaxID=562 RepID=UPI002118F638